MELEEIEKKHFKLKLDGLPDGYNTDGWTVTQDGVSYTYKDKEKVQHVVFVTLVPVILTADIIVDDVYKSELTYWNGSKFITTVVDNRTLSSNTAITRLSDIGIPCTSTNAKKFVEYFYDLRRINPIPKKICVRSLGWHGKEFAPYSSSVVTNIEQDILKQFTPKGTLANWIQIVKPLLKNEIVRLAIASSFASVLVKPLSVLSFMTYIHGGTGTGKTVACMVAMSVWMNPDKQSNPMFRKFSDTANSLMSMAATLGCLPMCIDEFQVSRHKGDNIVMNLCEGSEPGRLNKDGTRQKGLAWNNSFLANGEVSILDGNSGGGTVNRVIECDCGSKPLIDDGVKVVADIKQCYGTAGREFLKHISEAETVYKQCCKNFFELFPLVSDKQLLAAGAIATGDILMSKHIFNIEPLPLANYSSYLKNETEVSKAERAWEFVLGLILEHRRNFKTGKTDGDSFSFWGYVFEDGKIYFVRKVLEKQMTDAGYSFKECKKPWLEKGYLQRIGKRITATASAGGIRENYACLFVDDVSFVESIVDNEMLNCRVLE